MKFIISVMLSCMHATIAVSLLRGGPLERTMLHVEANASEHDHDPTAPLKEREGSASCIKLTGNEWPCARDTHQTAIQGTCACEPGFCSSVSGLCTQETNNQAVKFTLRNARYADRVLEIVGTVNTKEHGNIRAVALPVEDGYDAGGHILMALDNHAMACQKTKDSESSTSSILNPAQFEPDPDGCTLAVLPVEQALMKDIGVLLKLAPDYEGAPVGAQTLVVEFPRHKRFLSVAQASGSSHPIFGRAEVVKDDFGLSTDAFWIAEPPLPGITERYYGAECLFDCGALSAGANMSLRWTFSLVMDFLILVCCVGGCLYCCGCCESMPSRTKDESKPVAKTEEETTANADAEPVAKSKAEGLSTKAADTVQTKVVESDASAATQRP